MKANNNELSLTLKKLLDATNAFCGDASKENVVALNEAKQVASSVLDGQLPGEWRLVKKPCLMTIDTERQYILGRPNFWCGAVAAKLRHRGYAIEPKVEHEQAFVIEWCLEQYAEHGANWRRDALAVLINEDE